MRTSLVWLAAVALAGCTAAPETDVQQALADLETADGRDLGQLMLRSADPAEAVAYFRRGVADDPSSLEMRRGLSESLVRAGRPSDAAAAWAEVVDDPAATDEDRVAYADALIRSNEWTAAEALLDRIPPTHETYRRYRLEAMVADSNEEWDRADSFYETAAGLTTDPSSVLNNWGYSKLTRGDAAAAERLFAEALTYDGAGFTAKNNLVMARGAQRKYDLPLVQMTQTERAQLLHTLALSAIKTGDVNTGRSLLEQALATHPQHFEAAARSLDALTATPG